MAYITIQDLYTHIYPELVDEILRGDDAIGIQAIDAAVQETKLYLSKYDVVALLGNADQVPTMQDALLQHIVKTIACWNLVQLAHAGLSFDAQMRQYEHAIRTLTQIKEGTLMPQWPRALTTSEELVDQSPIDWYSTPKRNNHF